MTNCNQTTLYISLFDKGTKQKKKFFCYVLSVVEF